MSDDGAFRRALDAEVDAIEQQLREQYERDRYWGAASGVPEGFKEVNKMSLTRKIQVVAAALGGFITTTLGALLTLGVLNWTPEQTGAVSLIYSAAVGVVIAVAQVLSDADPSA